MWNWMTMNNWILIEKDVTFVRQMPYREFIADAYECPNCGNRTHDYDGLPEVCPWCKREMRGDK